MIRAGYFSTGAFRFQSLREASQNTLVVNYSQVAHVVAHFLLTPRCGRLQH